MRAACKVGGAAQPRLALAAEAVQQLVALSEGLAIDRIFARPSDKQHASLAWLPADGAICVWRQLSVREGGVQ